MTIFRPATAADIPAIAAIYNKILTDAEKLAAVGWQPGIYPTADTAALGVAQGDMYVQCDDNGKVLAAARINHTQEDLYAGAPWRDTAAAAHPQDVLVIHTLVADHTARIPGLGKAFIAFYEAEAKRRGCRYLRLDTNKINTPARSFYQALGFHEVGIVKGDFHGLAAINLVLIEKAL